MRSNAWHGNAMSSKQAAAQSKPAQPGNMQGMDHKNAPAMDMNEPPKSFVDEIQHHGTSGTSAEPNSTATPMLMTMKGKWMLMFHGEAFLNTLQQSGPRGSDKVFSTNWFMPMAQRQLGPGTFTVRAMLSFELGTVTHRFRMVHDQTVAEELALESFLCLYRSPNGFEEEKAAIWLYRVAVSLAVKHGEYSIRATRSSVTEASATVGEQQETSAQERVSAIRRHFEDLPDGQRLALLLHKYQGLDYQQIAEVMGISEPATKALLFEAYETLRLKLDRYM